MEDKAYHIALHSYYPDDSTKDRKKGEYLGGTGVYTKQPSLEKAIDRARELWLNWVRKFPACMIEIWINDDSDNNPKTGKVGSLFTRDNFEHFKPKRTTPF